MALGEATRRMLRGSIGQTVMEGRCCGRRVGQERGGCKTKNHDDPTRAVKLLLRSPIRDGLGT